MYSSRMLCLIHWQLVCYGKCGGIAPRYLGLSTIYRWLSTTCPKEFNIQRTVHHDIF